MEDKQDDIFERIKTLEWKQKNLFDNYDYINNSLKELKKTIDAIAEHLNTEIAIIPGPYHKEYRLIPKKSKSSIP